MSKTATEFRLKVLFSLKLLINFFFLNSPTSFNNKHLHT